MITYNLRFERWLNFLSFEQLPIDLLEEYMVQNCLFSAMACNTTESPVDIFGHKLMKERMSFD